MYSGVPTFENAATDSCESCRPKPMSPSFRVPEPVMNTLAGLISRCICGHPARATRRENQTDRQPGVQAGGQSSSRINLSSARRTILRLCMCCRPSEICMKYDHITDSSSGDAASRTTFLRSPPAAHSKTMNRTPSSKNESLYRMMFSCRSSCKSFTSFRHFSRACDHRNVAPSQTLTPRRNAQQPRGQRAAGRKLQCTPWRP
jgi:hypothetical protein